MLDLADNFEASVGQIIKSVSQAANEMNTSALSHAGCRGYRIQPVGHGGSSV